MKAKCTLILLAIAFILFVFALITPPTDAAYTLASPLPSQAGPATTTPTSIATPTQRPLSYTYTLSAGTIVTATNLLSGSQCANCVVPVNLPFPFTFYGQPYTTANVAARGNLQFTTSDTSLNSCPPIYPQLGPAILPNWDNSLDLSQITICQPQGGRPCGVYISVSGSAPNRIFNIEWLGRRIGSNTYLINFELRLYESTGVFDFVYGLIRPPGYTGRSSSIGIQDGSGSYINYACHVDNSLYEYLLLRWTPVGGGPTSTPMPTSVSTATATSTDTVTSTSTTTTTTLPTSTQTSLPTASPTHTSTTTVTVGPSTPTPCALTFTDVPAEHTFYTFIRCLACRGIISGYGDGTFRPNNSIIRGQIAKLVSNSAGFEEDPGTPIYTDVDDANPFYQWINRLTMRGHMSGYPCGGTFEPCDASNRPYFRPFANATRGQLSKIVANAAGISTPVPAGTQTYTDVLPINPFYLYIERLTALGVMSGYPCGGPDEPCDASNRPYFRPFAEVTRGQASKIVSNTFFPNCETQGR